jgi:hypothetical protein
MALALTPMAQDRLARVLDGPRPPVLQGRRLVVMAMPAALVLPRRVLPFGGGHQDRLPRTPRAHLARRGGDNEHHAGSLDEATSTTLPGKEDTMRLVAAGLLVALAQAPSMPAAGAADARLVPRATCVAQCAGLLAGCRALHSGRVSPRCSRPIIRACRHRRPSCIPGEPVPCLACWMPPTTSTTSTTTTTTTTVCSVEHPCQPCLDPGECTTTTTLPYS